MEFKLVGFGFPKSFHNHWWLVALVVLQSLLLTSLSLGWKPSTSISSSRYFRSLFGACGWPANRHLGHLESSRSRSSRIDVYIVFELKILEQLKMMMMQSVCEGGAMLILVAKFDRIEWRVTCWPWYHPSHSMRMTMKKMMMTNIMMMTTMGIIVTPPLSKLR